MMKQILIPLGLSVALGCGTVSAENRFLFIVETSKAMRRNLDATRTCVEASLIRSISGQIRAGDTIGVWTFDSELHTGVFPMQRWSPEARAYLAETTSAFLKQQRCRGKASLSEVLPEMFNVIENSDVITVLLFSEGSQPMQGTPFDDTINQIYEQHRSELKDANVPFVTVLQARGGKIVKCTIDSAASPVSISALPPLPEKEKTAPASQLQSEQLQTASPEKPRPIVVVTNAIGSNATVNTNPPLIVDYSATAPIPTRGAYKPEEIKSAAKSKPKAETKPLNVITSEVAQTVATDLFTNEPAPMTTNEARVTPPEHPVVAEANPVVTNVESPPVAGTNAQPILSPEPAATNLPAQPAMAAPAKGAVVRRAVLLAAMVLVLAVVAGLFFRLRSRARDQASSSLITKSFDRGKQP
jgi:hypothetical protein